MQKGGLLRYYLWDLLNSHDKPFLLFNLSQVTNVCVNKRVITFGIKQLLKIGLSQFSLKFIKCFGIIMMKGRLQVSKDRHVLAQISKNQSSRKRETIRGLTSCLIGMNIQGSSYIMQSVLKMVDNIKRMVLDQFQSLWIINIFCLYCCYYCCGKIM